MHELYLVNIWVVMDQEQAVLVAQCNDGLEERVRGSCGGGVVWVVEEQDACTGPGGLRHRLKIGEEVFVQVHVERSQASHLDCTTVRGNAAGMLDIKVWVQGGHWFSCAGCCISCMGQILLNHQLIETAHRLLMMSQGIQ